MNNLTAEIEQQLADRFHVESTMGFMTMEAYYEYKEAAIKGMALYGDDFSRRLGELLAVSDIRTTIKLMRLFYGICDQYVMLWRMGKAKLDALEAEGKLTNE